MCGVEFGSKSVKCSVIIMSDCFVLFRRFGGGCWLSNGNLVRFSFHGSVIDADDIHGGKQDATGFTFCSTELSDMANALTRALDRVVCLPSCCP